jgi:hypothetical protein
MREKQRKIRKLAEQARAARALGLRYTIKQDDLPSALDEFR